MSHSKSAGEPHDYWAFGLRVRSALELSEFVENEEHPEPDVQIELGPVAQPPGLDSGLASVGGALVLVIPDVARFRPASNAGAG